MKNSIRHSIPVPSVRRWLYFFPQLNVEQNLAFERVCYEGLSLNDKITIIQGPPGLVARSCMPANSMFYILLSKRRKHDSTSFNSWRPHGKPGRNDSFAWTPLFNVFLLIQQDFCHILLEDLTSEEKLARGFTSSERD